MKHFLNWFCILAAAFSGMAAESEAAPPEPLVFEVSPGEAFEVAARPGWRLLADREDAGAPYRSVLILGQDDRFSMQLTFFRDAGRSARFDTPDKMYQNFHRTMAPFYSQSVEKRDNIRVQVRSFTPAGRYGNGFAMRITDSRYNDGEAPAGEWKYLTSGMFRAGDETVALFSLMTDTIDDPEYLGLLDYIAAVAIPEQGGEGWQAATAADAYRIAEQALAERYSEEELAHQKPYSVMRRGDRWKVAGNLWVFAPGGTAVAEIDGASGEVLSVGYEE